MKNALVAIGAVVLVASVFGLSYADQQQGAFEQAENFLSGEQQDWNLIKSLSMAGIPLGIILVVAGLVPEEWYREYST